MTPPCLLPLRSLVMTQLAAAAPQGVVCISIADSPTAASQAAELGCASVEQLPPRGASEAAVHAAALQAVVRQAAAVRQAQGLAPPLVVGYVMKQSRQLALSQQGMLPLLPAAAAEPAAAGSAAGSQAAGAAAGAAAAAAAAAGAAAAAAGAAAPAAAAAAAAAAALAKRPLCCVPLDLHGPLQRQLAGCHMVLQKLTDCLQGGGSGAVAALNPEAHALLAALEQQQAAAAAGGGAPICLVDPVPALRPVMDRAALVEHLEAAALAVRQQAIPMRAPATVLLPGFDAAGTPRALAAAGVGLPCIVKPRAACGVAEAHQMAFVLHRCAACWGLTRQLHTVRWALLLAPVCPGAALASDADTLHSPHRSPCHGPHPPSLGRSSGFADLEVPLPAVAQEYVDHGGVVWKVYVAGQQVRPAGTDAAAAAAAECRLLLPLPAGAWRSGC